MSIMKYQNRAPTEIYHTVLCHKMFSCMMTRSKAEKSQDLVAEEELIYQRSVRPRMFTHAVAYSKHDLQPGGCIVGKKAREKTIRVVQCKDIY